jgi:hypothetical protein
MNQKTPETQVTVPGTVPLTQALIHTWSNMDLIRWCSPTIGITQPVHPWEFDVTAKHDLALNHQIPK